MNILSIDVGIKNLAYCLMKNTTPHNTILQWEAVNLCVPDLQCQVCQKKAKFMVEQQAAAFCLVHAKKQDQYRIPNPLLNFKKLPGMKLEKLLQVADEHTVPLVDVDVTDKEAVLDHLLAFVLQPVTSVSANDVNLIALGIALKTRFDQEFSDETLSQMDEIIIENQISPIANRMKTLQGMIAQYFIMRGNPHITFVSSSNKLKEFQTAEEKKNSSYADRKRVSTDITVKLLREAADGPNLSMCNFLTFFQEHAKKDDLADCFLQGRWYLQKKGVLRK